MNYANDQLKIEAVFTQYFTIENVIGTYLENPEILFEELRKIYLLSDAEALQALYKTSLDLREITSSEECNRQLRLLEYNRMIGRKVDLTEEAIFLLGLKATAYENLRAAGLLTSGQSAYTTMELLASQADEGYTQALGILGFLLLNGIFVTKDEQQGRRRLETGARWNDLFCLLTLLAYGENCRENLDKLYTLAQNKNALKVIFAEAKCRYAEVGYSPQVNEEAALLSESFNNLRASNSYLKKSKSNPIVLEVLQSDLFAHEVKRKILLSDTPATYSYVSEFPLTNTKPLLFSQSALNDFPFREIPEVTNFVERMNSDKMELPLVLKGSNLLALKTFETLFTRGFAEEQRLHVAWESLTDEELYSGRYLVNAMITKHTSSLVILIQPGLDRLRAKQAASKLSYWCTCGSVRAETGLAVNITKSLPVILGMEGFSGEAICCEQIDLESLPMKMTEIISYLTAPFQPTIATQKFLATLDADNIVSIVAKAERAKAGDADFKLTEEFVYQHRGKVRTTCGFSMEQGL